jgi:precorrin-2/cobalt-factor-2 C20-methyltransferase
VPYDYPTSVRKTSVYLPDALKAQLSAASARSGRSEADLIRVAIEQLVARPVDNAVPAPLTVPLPAGPRLLGVGVGPGDPTLLTQRALAVLAAASRVYAPAASAQMLGRAEMVVRAALPSVRVHRLVVDIGGDDARHGASLDAAAATLANALDGGRPIALVTLGDPMLYSTFPALSRRVAVLRPGVPVEVVPGVTAMQAVASAANRPLAEDDEMLTVVPNGGHGDAVERALASGGPVAIYRGGGALPAIAAALAARDRLGAAVIGELIGLTETRVEGIDPHDVEPASYLSTILVAGLAS